MPDESCWETAITESDLLKISGFGETMRSPSSSTTSGRITSRDQVNQAISRLVAQKDVWVRLPIPDRIAYLHRCIDAVMTVATAWVEAACHAKEIALESQLVGEEWIMGPAATLLNLRSLLHSLADQGQRQPVAVSIRPDGQQIAQVFPDHWMDKLLWLGFRGEVWLEPGQPASQGRIYREPSSTGQVALILGAGNVSSIAPMDMLSKLFAENQVVLIKMNPVNDYMGSVLEQAFQPLIADGFVDIVYGGAEMGDYLCQHPQIDSVHMTGSHHTHDAIVWGNSPEEQQHRRADNNPRLRKPITSELGCVTPILVVPGQWTQADLRFQARQIASMVAHNASFNCAAAQVVVTARRWSQREEFLQSLQRSLADIPTRTAYYPGAQQRYQSFVARYPQAIALSKPLNPSHLPWTVIADVPLVDGEYALTEEAFCGVLAEVTVDVTDPAEFLHHAIAVANQHIWGNLSCTILIDPATQKQYATDLDDAIANLRYGGIGINVWTGILYFLSSATWGAFPGNSLHRINSGLGVVHNTYLFDHPQKSVLSAPFRIRPTPLWFADHKNARQMAQRYTKLQANPRLGNFFNVILAALRG